LKDSLDYYSLDQDDEVALNKLIQEQLGRAGGRRPKRSPVVPDLSSPQLPLGMLGFGQVTAGQLLAIARKCKGDKECWLSELLAMKNKS
jgi:hypothetical protein